MGNHPHGDAPLVDGSLNLAASFGCLQLHHKVFHEDCVGKLSAQFQIRPDIEADLNRQPSGLALGAKVCAEKGVIEEHYRPLRVGHAALVEADSD